VNFVFADLELHAFQPKQECRSFLWTYYNDRVTHNNASDYQTNGLYRTPNRNPLVR